jgi:hypothetical protein
MQILRSGLYVLILTLSIAAVSCGGGGNGGGGVNIVSISTNPASVSAGTVVELSAQINSSQNPGNLIKNWTVSSGTLSTTAPDFSLLLRATAKGTSSSSASTAQNVVYWLTPTTVDQATITLEVESSTKTLTVSIGENPVTMSVTTGDGGAKTCSINANDMTDLYQAAFRVNFHSGWTPSAVEPGSFLGTAENILWLGLTDQAGFVPFAITRKGDAAGVDGSGTLARITFQPVSSGSSVSTTADQPFDLAVVVLRNSQNEPIPSS